MQIHCVSESLKKSKTFRASVLVEVGAAQDTGSYMSPARKIPYHKWESSIFFLALLYTYFYPGQLVKVKEAYRTWWTFLHLVKFYSYYCFILLIHLLILFVKSREAFEYIFFFTLKCRKYLSKIQLTPISKCYLKFNSQTR